MPLVDRNPLPLVEFRLRAKYRIVKFSQNNVRFFFWAIFPKGCDLQAVSNFKLLRKGPVTIHFNYLLPLRLGRIFKKEIPLGKFTTNRFN